MSVNKKTHAETIADMRYKAGAICPWQVNGGTCELCPLGHSPHGKDLGKYCSFHKLAHELEAAHKRELDELRKQVGDRAKLREALSDACYAMFNFLKTRSGGYEEMANALDKAKAALAAPPRNCDVGNAEEQTRRFMEFCIKHDECMKQAGKCPVFKKLGACKLEWAQMPYEEGGDK